MRSKPILTAVLALSLVTLACSATINLPVQNLDIGPTETTDISVLLLEDEDEIANVTLGFGAGEFYINPGAEDELITGTATYNVEDFAPEVLIDGNDIRIEQGDTDFDGIPNFDDLDDLENVWNLELAAVPMDLKIEAGAYAAEYELGGLALHDLHVSDGAADVTLSFSEPNLVEMDTLQYDTGASSVALIGLANANFEDLIFNGGAGDYTLDFTGELQRDATVTVKTGLSNLIISIPDDVPAEVSLEGGLSEVSTIGDWARRGSTYTQDGEGPMLTIDIELGVGDLTLRNP